MATSDGSSATPAAPEMPPRSGRLMWQATPSILGSSKPSTAMVSFGPSQRKLVETEPTWPRGAPPNSHQATSATSASTTASAISFHFIVGRPSPVARGAARREASGRGQSSTE